MTLQEAIEHAKSKAIELGGCECADEHLQLAEWLTDLQELTKNGYSHFCKNMDNNYLTFVSAALSGILASGKHDSKDASLIAVECAKEVIRQLKLQYPYKQ